MTDNYVLVLLKKGQVLVEKLDNLQHGAQIFILVLHLEIRNGKRNGNGNLEQNLTDKEDAHFLLLMTFLEDHHLQVLHLFNDGNGIKNKKEDNGWNGNGEKKLKEEKGKKKN